MSQLVKRKGFKIESIGPEKKKKKDKNPKTKDVGHVHIIDDDAPVPFGAITEPDIIPKDEIVSIEDDPIVVGMDILKLKIAVLVILIDIFRYG
jgi:hypothetical protein